MSSDIRVGRGSNIAPKIGRYREGQGRGSPSKDGEPLGQGR